MLALAQTNVPPCFDFDGAGTSFLRCCSTRVYGPGGNPACWDSSLGSNFEQCCLSSAGDLRESDLDETLAGAAVHFQSCVVALAALIHRFDIERHVLGERVLSLLEAEFFVGLVSLLPLWRASQLRRLHRCMVTRRHAAPAFFRALPPPHADQGAKRLAQGARIGIVIACTPESAGQPGCQLGANLWQCYAHGHGYDFVFDTSPYATKTREFRFGASHLMEPSDSHAGECSSSPWASMHEPFTELDFSFLRAYRESELLASDALDFKWWQRWYAARRHLPFFDLLLVVDPDTAVFPSCFGLSLVEALRLPVHIEDWPGVITRDARDGEDTNGGVFAIVNNVWGNLFLELLLDRSTWPIDVAGGGGWCHARQSAEFETLLEIIALDDASHRGGDVNYDSECMRHAVPQPVPSGDTGKIISGCVWPLYRDCWDTHSRRLIGPPGNRTSRMVWLLDPTVVDINYRPWSNEPRYQMDVAATGNLPPIAHAAFLWHYVGVRDKVGSLIRDFGLSTVDNTLDCQSLLYSFMLHLGGRLPMCRRAGSSEPCPFAGSSLMPRIWGC